MYKEYYLITYRVKGSHLEEPIKITCRDDKTLELYIEELKKSPVYYDIKIYKVLETCELLYELDK